MLKGLLHVNTQFYKQPAHKEYSKGQLDEILDGMLSSEQLGTSKSGIEGYGERLMPAVYGLHPAMNLSALWYSGDRCSCTYTHLPPSLQYSTVYPFNPDAPTVSGVVHLMVRLQSFTSSTDTSRGALEGAVNSEVITKISWWDNKNDVLVIAQYFLKNVFYFVCFFLQILK